VIIEQYSQSSSYAGVGAEPVSPIPEIAEVVDDEFNIDIKEPYPVEVVSASSAIVVSIPSDDTTSEVVTVTAESEPTTAATAVTATPPTAPFDVTIDASRPDINSTPLKRTSVCGAICNCFRALFKACCCGCCCCCSRRRRTNNPTTLK
jgi:hypothetical protein